jgi:hypothetical protein
LKPVRDGRWFPHRRKSGQKTAGGRAYHEWTFKQKKKDFSLRSK